MTLHSDKENEFVKVHDIADREHEVRRKNLKPSTWQQGNEVFTVI